MSRLLAHRHISARMGLVTLAAALILGVVAMHGLMGASATGSASTTVAEHPRSGMDVMDAAGTVEAAHDGRAASGGDAGPPSMMDCGTWFMACLALAVALAGLLLLRGRSLRRLLWQRVRMVRVAVGRARPQMSTLTPLQRTAILRC